MIMIIYLKLENYLQKEKLTLGLNKTTKVDMP